MKPGTNFERDSTLTASSHFTLGGAKGATDPYLRSLPIEAWYFGTRFFSSETLDNNSQYWLQWDEQNCLYVKQGPLERKSRYTAQFFLDRQVVSVQVCFCLSQMDEKLRWCTLQYSQDPAKRVRDIVVLHMTTAVTPRPVQASIPFGEHFRPGIYYVH